MSRKRSSWQDRMTVHLQIMSCLTGVQRKVIRQSLTIFIMKKSGERRIQENDDEVDRVKITQIEELQKWLLVL